MRVLVVLLVAMIYSYGNLYMEHKALKKSHDHIGLELADLVRQNSDAAGLCYTMCNTFQQDYRGVLGYNYGGCFCDNDEGQKMQDGYEYMLYLQEKERTK